MTLFTEPYASPLPPTERRRSQSYLHSITAILVSRFLISLQEVDRDVAGIDTDVTSAAISWSGGVHFAFVGSLASSVLRDPSQALEHGFSVDLAMDGPRNECGEVPAEDPGVSEACRSDESAL